MSRSISVWWKTSLLAVAGGLGFWFANLAISLTPVAAEYRAALSISYAPMLVEALAGGLVIGLCVSYGLLRYFRSIPTNSPISKSLVLCFVALLVVTVVIEIPAKLLTPTTDALRYLGIATIFNVLRVATLGVVIGWLYERLERSDGT